jgi:hypothetical protein
MATRVAETCRRYILSVKYSIHLCTFVGFNIITNCWMHGYDHLQFLYNKTNQMHKFPKFTPAWNSTRFGQFLCPSSGVYSLYTQQWYMAYRFVDSFRAGPGWNSFWSCSKAVYKPEWHIPVPSVQWINNSWWQADELPGTSRVSCRSKFGKLVYLVGFIIKKFVKMHSHMDVKLII